MKVRHYTTRRAVTLVGFAIIIGGITGIVAYDTTSSSRRDKTTTQEATSTPLLPDPFPLGVNPETKTITEQPNVDVFVTTEVASNHTAPSRERSWFALVFSTIERWSVYQQLATPSERTAIIWSGERAEQIQQTFKQLFGWSTEESAQFTTAVQTTAPSLVDGTFYPGRYSLPAKATPELAAQVITDRFRTEVTERYPDSIAHVVPLTDILIIASLIEREAYDFNDMRYISGIIWNRLFIDMPLQIDSTLQYARGVTGTARSWWPIPRPADKFIESPYNTYLNSGLPPAPIANPSIEAIVAALNPRQTDCLFYFHATDGTFYCSTTYEEHLENIERVFSTGTH